MRSKVSVTIHDAQVAIMEGFSDSHPSSRDLDHSEVPRDSASRRPPNFEINKTYQQALQEHST